MSRGQIMGLSTYRKEDLRMYDYVVSCVTREYGKMKKVWEAKRRNKPLPHTRDEYKNGEVRYYTHEHILLWRRVLLFPMGITIVDSYIFVCTNNYITVLDRQTGATVEEFHHPLFNDLHSIVYTGYDFIVTSSGSDRILRLTPNGRQIEGDGIIPDFEVERTKENYDNDYDPQLDKAIERIKKEKAKTVLIQLPDGLKPKAKEIKTTLEKKTDAEILFWGGSCFGACDIPKVDNIDLLIQFGHSKWQNISNQN